MLESFFHTKVIRHPACVLYLLSCCRGLWNLGRKWKQTLYVRNIVVGSVDDDGFVENAEVLEEEWTIVCMHYNLKGCSLNKDFISRYANDNGDSHDNVFRVDNVTAFRVHNFWAQENEAAGQLLHIRKHVNWDWGDRGYEDSVKVLRMLPQSTGGVAFIRANGRFVGYFLRHEESLALEALVAEQELYMRNMRKRAIEYRLSFDEWWRTHRPSVEVDLFKY